jgi:glycosyltransferase involved in cell wall biosynthesis
MPPRVFVFIPAYNVSLYLADAIESVLIQTYKNWELLILDDCSSDDTSEIVESFIKRDSRIKYVKNEKNLGMLRNWNKGITYCNSEFFAKLDGDDIWHPEMIEEALKILDADEKIAMVFSNYLNLDNNGKIIEQSQIDLPDFARNRAFSCLPLVKLGASKMLSYPVLRQGISLIRFDIFQKVGPYRFLLTEKTQASTDTEFYFRVGCHHLIYCIDKVLYYYRLRQDSISSLNTVDGLSEVKMYEVKTVINNYYFAEGEIEKKLWVTNKNETNFRYLIFLHYQARRQSQLTRVLRLSIELLKYPLQTMNHFKNKLKS